MSNHYVLKIQYADGRPAETRKLDASTATIGRDQGDIILNDPQSSGRHAELRFAGGQVTVRDVGSTNGTFFKGSKTATFGLSPGDSFTIGQSILTLMEVVSPQSASAGPKRTMIAMGGVPNLPPRPGAAPPPPRPGGPPPPGGRPPAPGGFQPAGPPPPGARPGGPPPPGARPGGPPPPGARPGGPPPPGARPGGPPPPGAAPPAPGGVPPSMPMTNTPLPRPGGAPADGGGPGSSAPTMMGMGMPAMGGPSAGAPSTPVGAPAAAPAAAPATASAVGSSAPSAAAMSAPSAAASPPAAAAPAALGAAVAAAPPSGALPLEPRWLQGEEALHTLHADGLYLGPTPVMKLMSLAVGALIRLTGGHIRISVVVTPQRVLLLQSTQAFCGFARTKLVQALALGSVAECGWAKTTTYFCVNSRAMSLKTKTQTHALVIRKLSDAQLRDFTNQLSAVVVSNVQAGTAT